MMSVVYNVNGTEWSAFKKTTCTYSLTPWPEIIPRTLYGSTLATMDYPVLLKLLNLVVQDIGQRGHGV